MFAHRGARSHARDNTIEAFELALRLGATGLETDVWLTSDGVPVLDHDGVIRRGVRRRHLREFSRHELPPHIPSLADLVDACGSDFHLSIDVKDPDAAGPVVDVVRSAGDLVTRTWLCHPDLDQITAWREPFHDVKLINSTRLEELREGPERRAATIAARGLDGINLHQSEWTGGLVVLFHRFEVITFGWGYDFEHQLSPGFRMGLDGVFGDDVDMMHSVYAAESGR